MKHKEPRRLVFRARYAVVGVIVILIAAGAIWAKADTGGSRITRNDQKATEAYIDARYALEKAMQEDLPATEAAVNRLVAQIRATCGGILRGAPGSTGSPKANASGQPLARSLLFLEADKDVEVAAIRSQLRPREKFANAALSLRWSRKTLTRIVDAVVQTEAAWLKYRAPDIYADAETWVKSGYHKVASGTTKARFGLRPIPRRVASELEQMGYSTRYPAQDVLQLLAHFEVSSDKAKAAAALNIEAVLARDDTLTLLGAQSQVESALDT